MPIPWLSSIFGRGHPSFPSGLILGVAHGLPEIFLNRALHNIVVQVECYVSLKGFAESFVQYLLVGQTVDVTYYAYTVFPL